MKFEIQGNPDYGDLLVQLDPGEKIYSESGAMNRMIGPFEVGSRLLGGLLRSIVRKFLGGESLFLAEYTAQGSSQVAFSPRLPGTILHRKLNGDSIILTGGSFLACTPGVDLRLKFGGIKAFFSKEGAFTIVCSGTGDLFYNSFGAVIEKEVDGSLIVDNGHLVAWDPTLDYQITSAGGLKSTLFSGEGLVMQFRGRGKIALQSRHLGALVGWIRPYCK